MDNILDLTLDEDEMRQWLAQHHYDGLWCDCGDEYCGCGLDDLRPCDYDPEFGCTPAHRHFMSDGSAGYYPGHCNDECERFGS